MEEPSILNELRNSVLSKAGIKNITPSDCREISTEIHKKLNKTVSETTIKRLFGFAVVKHKFSKFTLNTLAEYAHTQDIMLLSGLSDLKLEQPVTHWDEIREHAARITEYTIKSVKNRSGIPYEMTVSRKFAEHDFEDFLRSQAIFMVFISHPGYGKTILLNHLAENLLASEIPCYKQSILLFATAVCLFNKQNTATSFELRVKKMLNIPEHKNLVELANENFVLTGGKLIIFLDGFYEISLQKELRRQLFIEVVDFICAIEDSPYIKVVMGMRTTTWTRFYDHMRHSSFLRKKWFPGNYFNTGDVSNVPPLTEREVDSIMSKINLPDANSISPRLRSQLRYPFHIELYYQLKEEDPHFKYATNITFFELISRFIQDKIYRANYYTEKILFLKKVIQLTDYGRLQDMVAKDDLIRELSAFKNAYSELLSDGILMEEKSPEEFHPKEYVRFIHTHIFEYFLFIELLEKFNLKIDGSFFDYLSGEYHCDHSKFQILQWTGRFMVKTGDFESLTNLFKLEMTNYERNYLILFIAENLDYKLKHSTEKEDDTKLDLLHDAIIEQLISFDFADSCYKAGIDMLLQVSRNKKHQIIYNALLAIYALLNIDAAEINVRLQTINDMPDSPEKDQFSSIISAAHGVLTRDKKEKVALLNVLNGLIAMPSDSDIEIEEAISILIAAHSGLLIYDSKSVSLFDKIAERINRKTIVATQPHEQLIISIIELAKTFYRSSGNAIAHLEILADDVPYNKIGCYTESVIRLSRSFELKHRDNLNAALQIAIECLKFFKSNKLHINTLIAYDLIIDLFKKKNDIVRQSEYVYEKLCFLEDNGIPATRVIYNVH
ncbi:MAG: hypothetical protein V4687_10705 [Bacteroidota bacterium]